MAGWLLDGLAEAARAGPASPLARESGGGPRVAGKLAALVHTCFAAASAAPRSAGRREACDAAEARHGGIVDAAAAAAAAAVQVP